MKITASSDLGNIEKFEDFKRFSTSVIDQLKTAMNGGVAIENLKATLATVVFNASGSDIQVGHKLGSIPLGYYKIAGDNFTVYDAGKSSWTTENIYIRSTATGTASILVVG